jgi:hypothetical protein
VAPQRRLGLESVLLLTRSRFLSIHQQEKLRARHLSGAQIAKLEELWKKDPNASVEVGP